MPVTRKPLLLFDMDGTLIIPKEEKPGRKLTAHSLSSQSRQQMKDIAYSYGVPSSEIDPLDRMAHIWNKARRYAETHRFTEERITKMMADLNEPFTRQESLEHSLSVLLPGTIEALDSLARDSFMIGIVTTASRAGYESISSNEKFGNFGRYFTHSITRDDCCYIKPDPEPINRILSLFSRSDFVYIGDSDHDAEATKAAGGRFILLNIRGYDEKMIQYMNPAGIITSLRELPDMISRMS